MSTASSVFETDIEGLERIGRGKVRDIYAVGEDHLLIVATDRISAFDVVLPDPIPGKGEVLTSLSEFWFDRTESIVPNHRSDLALTDAIADAGTAGALATRASVVQRLDPLPIEAIVRGYIIGSGWKDYQASGAVCGIALPSGLRQADRLPEPIFTPSTKAAIGDHDENIDFERTVALVGTEMAAQVRDVSIALYARAAEIALGHGIIIADTKFEFGLDAQGRLVLIDEVLTPDSSRFWPLDEYTPGTSPPSYDKQYVRDYLESVGWDKSPPAPRLPAEVIERTASKYAEAKSRLTQ